MASLLFNLACDIKFSVTSFPLSTTEFQDIDAKK
jgi:hypothetical protein